MTKVALFISGQPRFVDSISYKYIKQNILDKYDCDVFCHTWFDTTVEMSTAPWSGLNGFKCKGNELELIKTLYTPKAFTYDIPLKNEDIDISHFKYVENPKTPFILTSMYTSMKRCFQNFLDYYAGNPPKYDVYIRLRYDIIPTVIPDLNTLETEMMYFVHHHGDRPVLANNMIISTSFKGITLLMNVLDKLNHFGDLGYKINDEEVIYYLITGENMAHKKIKREYFKDILPQELNFKIYE
jgi:hypothetical protein